MPRIWFVFLLVWSSVGIGSAQAPSEHPSTQQSVERELRLLNKEVADMQMKKDAVAAARLLAEDYVFLQADGNVSNKAQNVAVLRDPSFVCESLVTEDVVVRVYGEAAVITGRAVMRATYGGQDVGGEFLYTDVWAKHGGRWQTVVSQATRVP
jgi:ketosteroid isomerase-like protein